MDLKDSLEALSSRIEKLKENIQTEEATKNAFIMPFIASLGYDVFNPLEVIPELDCDLNKKKGEKIDYAIAQGGEIMILIECKHWKQPLDLHETQLKRYFVASNAKFAILTNGIRYCFYTDLVKPNIMDEKPFLDINLLDLKDFQIEEIKKFHKSYFDIDAILSSASELKYANELRAIFAEEVANPSAEFVRLFAKQVYDGVITAKVQEQFTYLLKRSISLYITEQISNRLKNALDNTNDSSLSDITETEVATDSNTADNSIVTTEEELEGYMIVKSIVRTEVDLSRVCYRDAQTYFAILLDDNNRKPICRLHFNSATKKYISVFRGEDRKEFKVEILSLNDIYNYTEDLCAIIRMYLNK